MATISSTLRLQDRFTKTIDNTIHAMTRMVDAMENLNRSADLPNMEQTFGEIRSDISLASHALDQFNDELRNTDQHTNTVSRLSSGFGGLSRSIIVANQGLQLVTQTWNQLQKLGSLSDERMGVDARLSLINDGLRTQEQLELQVMQVANDTRMEYAATGALIAKMGRQDYFKGNNDSALAFAETLNKGLVVSGASTVESQSALLQLSQGLASGVLRGEEFNSIMENGSVIAEMMAASLGVTKGELRSMAEDGMLTTDVVVSSIMGQSDTINKQFQSMPVTFGQAMTVFDNHISGLMNTLSQPGQAVDVLITKVDQLNAWLNTEEGAVFFENMAAGIGLAIDGLVWLFGLVSDTYQFFNDNWTTIEPILWGIGTAVGGITTAYLIYKGVALATSIANSIMCASKMLATGATVAETAAQWGLNSALLACPLTWIVIAVMAVIAVYVMLISWTLKAWETNVNFKVNVIQIWNSILGFFDQVPIFFMGIGNGIMDAFSYAKIGTMVILDALVNGAVERINWLIDKVNKIPGVSIDAIGAVTFGAETVVEEKAKIAERAAGLAEKQAQAAKKAADRQNQLAQDEITWRAEAEAKKQKKQEDKASGNTPFKNEYEFPPVKLAGGKIDKIGSEVDISNQSLEYLKDIAEIEVLGGIESTMNYVQSDSLKLSQEDADLMRASANSNTNVYYIQYSGGVRIKNDVKKGEDWESIKQQLREESQNEIDTGISGIEEVVYG